LSTAVVVKKIPASVEPSPLPSIRLLVTEF
jgi:hypothetical protein